MDSLINSLLGSSTRFESNNPSLIVNDANRQCGHNRFVGFRFETRALLAELCAAHWSFRQRFFMILERLSVAFQ